MGCGGRVPGGAPGQWARGRVRCGSMGRGGARPVPGWGCRRRSGTGWPRCTGARRCPNGCGSTTAGPPATSRYRGHRGDGSAGGPRLSPLTAVSPQDVAALEYRAPHLAAASLSFAFPAPRAEARLLDVACGTGLVAREVPAGRDGTGRAGDNGTGRG